jgi:hypothetical protein
MIQQGITATIHRPLRAVKYAGFETGQFVHTMNYVQSGDGIAAGEATPLR